MHPRTSVEEMHSQANAVGRPIWYGWEREVGCRRDVANLLAEDPESQTALYDNFCYRNVKNIGTPLQTIDIPVRLPS